MATNTATQAEITALEAETKRLRNLKIRTAFALPLVPAGLMIISKLTGIVIPAEWIAHVLPQAIADPLSMLSAPVSGAGLGGTALAIVSFLERRETRSLSIAIQRRRLEEDFDRLEDALNKRIELADRYTSDPNKADQMREKAELWYEEEYRKLSQRSERQERWLDDKPEAIEAGTTPSLPARLKEAVWPSGGATGGNTS